jgi:hypothetical protein
MRIMEIQVQAQCFLFQTVHSLKTSKLSVICIVKEQNKALPVQLFNACQEDKHCRRQNSPQI